MNTNTEIKPQADNAVRQDVTAFLKRHVGKEMTSPSENIFKEGYVNSLFIMQLVNFVETTLGTPVEDDDLDIVNFESIDNITAFVERKKGEKVAAQDRATC